MKQAKVYKIALTLITAVMFVLAGLSLIFSSPVYAEELGNYFSGTYTETKLEDNAVKFTVSDGQTVMLKNSLVINELAFDVDIPSEVKSVTLTFNTKTYDVNGNYVDGNNVFDTVAHKLTLNTDGSASSFNETDGETPISSGNVKIYFKVVGSLLGVSLNDNTDTSFFGNATSKYLVKNVGKCIANALTFTFDLVDGSETAVFSLNSVDQGWENYTAGEYKQTFETENGEIKTKAKARIALNESIYISTATGYELNAFLGSRYSLEFTPYSVLGNVYKNQLYIAEGTNLWLSNEDKPNEFIFGSTLNNVLEIKDSSATQETFTFNVAEKNLTTNSAPTYKDPAQAESLIESYKVALGKAILADYNGVKYCIRLGDEVTVPSMESLICDDYTAYNNLTHTLYYRTPETTGSVTDWDIPTDKAGEYQFYVVFKDADGEAMKTDDFYTFDDNDENLLIPGQYYAYVFKFTIIDDAPISVTSVNQSKGYVDTTYTVSSFNISATGYTPTYELYYNSDLNAQLVGEWENTWTLIPKASSVGENDTMPEGFTYEEIQSIAYDGSLTFTPDRVGKYVIKCTVSSSSSVRSASGTAMVEVQDKPNVVTPANPWLRENVWSVVFLSVGTVCLIAVIILLFIKPKDKAEEK
ncbi:MAG: hypothetical protein IJW47_00605 [Clostridia bacterium]|nr:hypothetical protein [Clostridia bacterium]